MQEGFNPPPKKPDPSRREVLFGMAATAVAVGLPSTLEKSATQERIEKLRTFFADTEKILEVEGRDKAKLLTEPIYKEIQYLNSSNMSDWQKIWEWNPQGNLSEAEFNELNLRRKLLSNAIGIMTANGVRHDLNEI